MTAKLINGLALAEDIVESILQSKFHSHLKHLQPGLAFITVGHDPASEIYVRKKQNLAAQLGYYIEDHALPTKTTQAELIKVVQALNVNAKIHGILIQLPLPAHIDVHPVLETIDPQKDVDGFSSYNLGRLAQNHPALRPCTPAGIMYMLQHTGKPLLGLNAVVLGRSQIVGLPMSLELLRSHCTVTICHSQTPEALLLEHLKKADIVIAALGKPGFVKGPMLKPGVIAIDVGIHRSPEAHDSDGKSLTGDLEFDSVQTIASHVSPVPGGVGPMTVAMLMRNTWEAAVQQGDA